MRILLHEQEVMAESGTSVINSKRPHISVGLLSVHKYINRGERRLIILISIFPMEVELFYNVVVVCT